MNKSNKVTVVFESLNDFKKFLDNPKSVKLGQITVDSTGIPEPKRSSSEVVFRALKELNGGLSPVAARRIAFHALDLSGLRKTKRNINNVYANLSTLVKKGSIVRMQKGVYMLPSTLQ